MDRFTVTTYLDGSININMAQGDAKEVLKALGLASVHEHNKLNSRAGRFYNDMSQELFSSLVDAGIIDENEDI